MKTKKQKVSTIEVDNNVKSVHYKKLKNIENNSKFIFILRKNVLYLRIQIKRS